MKNQKFLLVVMFCLPLVCGKLTAQNVSISEDNTYTPDAAAMLDVYSTNKGLLVPRVALVSTTNPISVTKPNGLLVWNTSVTGSYPTPGFYFWNGSDWTMVGSTSLSFLNGISQSGSQVKLGGLLTENTTITQGNYGMIYNLSGTGDFDVQDNGTSAFFVGDNGSVGIGNNSPCFKADVVGSSGSIMRLRANTTTTGSQARLNFSITSTNPSNQTYSSYIGGERTASAQELVFGTASTASGTPVERMRITGSGAVGIGTTTPDGTAVLDVTSTSKGVLVPRMTATQRAAITTPTNGLLVYDTTYGSFFYYNSTKATWVNLGAKNSGTTANEALFAVVNNAGDTVFAVYQEGVQINVGDGLSKASKGGFAVAGIGSGKALGNDYLRVTPDSVRIYVEDGIGKASKGGFAVAGIGSGKAVGNEYLRVTTDSIRLYVENTDGKASKGGFAVAGIGSGKGLSTEYMRITNDSVRIYVEEGAGKSSKGGFAVAGIGSGKGTTKDILKVTKDSTRINVADPNAGFGIGNTETGSSLSLMRLTKENYFIGHESGINNFLGLGDNGRYNSFIGYQAGKMATTGFRNVLLGYQSGLNLNQGYDNIFIGYKSGFNVTNAFNNVFIGTNVGVSSTGSSNIFVGDSVGFANLDGYDNVFMGFASGKANTSGHHNVFMGSNSAKSNLSGNDNVMIGANAGFKNNNGSSNVLIGDRVGYYNTDGSFNVILGNLAGYKNTIGADNIMMGYEAGYSNVDGSGNVYIGKESGHTDTNGADNVYIGRRAGYSNNLGLHNVFIGSEAGESCDASENTYIGFQTGINANGSYNTLLGTKAGYYRVAGNTSVLIGTEAGYFQQGSDNTYIGAYAGRGASSKTGVKNVFIGYSAGYYETGSNKLYIESCDNSYTDATKPLIYGDFNLNQVIINNALAINSTKTAPTVALDVTGDAKVSGTLTASSLSGSITGSLTGNVNTGYAGYTGYSASGPRFQYFSTTAKLYGEGLLLDDGTYIGTAYNGPRVIFDDTNDDISLADCNVGIGTETPSYKLTVNADAATTTSGSTAAYFSSTAGATSGTAYGLRCYSSASGSSNSYAVYADADGGSTTGREWAFYGLGDSYFSGDIGIGVVPSSSHKLGISANSTTSYPHLELIETSASDGSRIVFSNSNEPTNTWTLYGRGDDTDASSTFNLYYSNYGNIISVSGTGTVKMPEVYNTAVGTTNRYLRIDDTGLIGYVSSSKRYKKNIVDMEDISWLYNLRPVNFIYKNDSIGIKQYGLIAEEVESVNKLFVSYNKNGQVETVNYENLITPLLKATQEQQAIIENQQTEIEILKKEVKRINELEKQIQELKELMQK